MEHSCFSVRSQSLCCGYWETGKRGGKGAAWVVLEGFERGAGAARQALQWTVSTAHNPLPVSRCFTRARFVKCRMQSHTHTHKHCTNTQKYRKTHTHTDHLLLLAYCQSEAVQEMSTRVWYEVDSNSPHISPSLSLYLSIYSVSKFRKYHTATWCQNSTFRQRSVFIKLEGEQQVLIRNDWWHFQAIY